MSHAFKNRLPKYHRSNEPPHIRNLKDYLPLLELIQEHHFINTAQIIALSPVSRTNTYAKLQKLYHNGLIERYALPSTEFTQGSEKMIYTLDRKGAETLTELNPERYRNVYYPKRRRGVYCVVHALMITNLRVCLTLAFRKKRRPDTGVEKWAQGKALEQMFERHQENGSRIIPDGYFVIHTPKKVIHYFLEADRGTMKLVRFAGKIRRYRKFFTLNRERLPACFRVITLAPSERRAENLRTLTIQSDPKGEGSERFWFASETVFNLANPTQILAPLFRPGLKGAKDKRLSLLF